MDRKTMGLLVTEALLIVVLVVVIAMDFNKPEHVASHDAATEAVTAEDAAGHEAVAEEAAEATHEKAEEEATEEKAEAKHEKAAEEVKEEKAEAKHEKAAEEKHEIKAEEKAAGGGPVADVIAMEASVYDKHTKGIVQFTHKKHAEEYKISCGDCHHDDSGAPLADLKMGDEVSSCAECHSKTGKPEKGISKEEKREFHKEALHDNCISCHKDHNKKNKTKAAPASCGQCHPKNK